MESGRASEDGSEALPLGDDEALRFAMQRIFRISRFEPGRDETSWFQEYRLDAAPTESILDCLNRIRWEQDPSLAFRMSCAHGVCGSDGMRINGVCALACQKFVRDYPVNPIVVEPLPNLPVLKDLIVDLDVFFQFYSAIKPYLLPAEPAQERERIQSPAERAVFEEAIRCILCACCTTACPITSDNPKYLGPAALLRAFRYLFDSRDGAADGRIKLLDNENGIWGCKGQGKCTEVCPKEIDVRKWLGRVKKRIHDARKAGA